MSVQSSVQRNGLRGQIVLPNGDRYKGEWKDDLMHGKGLYESKRHKFVYEGDFANGRRDGYGVLMTTADGGRKKVYAGHWKEGKMHSQGTYFYNQNGSERYEGEWFAGERSGWGRMYYQDGSIYEGEWLADQRSGKGLYLLENGNRYEGSWLNDKKHGEGCFFYIDKGQCYRGTWKDGSPKCGELFDLEERVGDDGHQRAIPQLGLEDAEGVLDRARTSVLGEQSVST